jgi:hypothetical protein
MYVTLPQPFTHAPHHKHTGTSELGVGALGWQGGTSTKGHLDKAHSHKHAFGQARFDGVHCDWSHGPHLLPIVAFPILYCGFHEWIVAFPNILWLS